MTRLEALRLLRNLQLQKIKKVRNVATREQVIAFLENERENVRTLRCI